MKFKELKAMNPAELDEKLVELKKELLKMRGQIAVGAAPKSAGKVRNVRRTIAKIHAVKSMPKSGMGGAKAST